MAQDGRVKVSIRAGKPKKNQAKEKPAIRILVENLRVGDLIATTLREHSLYGVVAVHTQKIETIELCNVQWRTHIHINKKDCYDSRTYVHVAVTSSARETMEALSNA